MSLSIFKQSMISFMGNPNGIDSFNEFTSNFVRSYDTLIRSGFQTINNIPLQSGNVQLMETLVNIACQTLLTKTSGQFDFISEIGKGIIGYWTGASLVTGLPPVIPAVGAYQNIATTSAIINNPGTFPSLGPQLPTLDTSSFVELLSTAITIHLTTISGIYLTLSLYPGFPPPPPAPGIVQWNGYTVPS